MISLGIDPSLRAYGWAIHDCSASGIKRRIASGHESTLPSSVPVARFLHFQTLVKSLINEYNPKLVGIESPAYSAGPFQTIHFGLMMFSLVPVFESRIDCALFDPATLKLLAKEDPSMKGGMSKLDMQRKVQIDTMDSNLIDNNEADAYLVAKFASRLKSVVDGKLDPQNLTKSELKVFLLKTKKVKTATGTKIKRIAHVFKENSRYFEFSRVPLGSVSLPKKSDIPNNIIEFLESLEE